MSRRRAVPGRGAGYMATRCASLWCCRSRAGGTSARTALWFHYRHGCRCCQTAIMRDKVLSILVCHLPKSAKHMLIVEFAYLEIASAAERYRTSMAKYLPERLGTLYRSGRARAINGLTSSNSAINEIEGQCHERSDFCHRFHRCADDHTGY